MSPLIACTVVSCADLPAARVAASGYLEQHPGARFVTLVVDGHDGRPDTVGPSDIGLGADDLAALASGNTAEEACAALRPRLLSWLLEQHGQPVLYLAPHVRVFAPLADLVTAALTDAATVLVPRVLRPLPDDGLRPTPTDLREAGLYEDGLIAVAPGAEHFLHAWADASAADPTRAGVFLDSAPTLVDHRVLRDPGLGLSRWNAGQRPLARTPELTIAGVPLRVLDLTGFDPSRPWLLSARIPDRPRVLLSEHPVLSRLCADYAGELAGAPAPTPTVYFGHFADGVALPDTLRTAYRTAPERPPAAATDPAGYLRWACAPDPDMPDGSRWAVALWRDDPALRTRFPNPFGSDAAAYRDWCATDAVVSGRIHPRAVPGQTRPDFTLVDQIGVSVVGEGPLTDRLRAAVRASGLPTSDDPIYPVVLTAGQTTGLPQHRHVVAVRPDAAPLTVDADERWVVWPTAPTQSDGVATHTVPLPVDDPGARDDGDRDDARHAFGLADEPTFVAMADRADDLLVAFAAAFPTRSDVRLLLLVPPDEARTEAIERLRLAADPRVRLVGDPALFDRAVDAASWAIVPHDGEAATWLTRVGLRGVPVVTIAGGTAAELLGEGCVPLPVDKFAADTMIAGAIRDLADDGTIAAKVGTAARDHLLTILAPAATGAALRRRVELAYRNWRAGRALATATEDDPLRALRTAKHALLRRPDVEAGYRIPMAPALRRAVLRVLDHYDNHLNSVLASLVDGIERTAVELVERQEQLAGAGAGLDVDLLRADIDLVADRNTQLARQVSAAGEEMLRLRSEVANRLRAVDDLAARGDSERVIALTEALAASQARIDAIEARLAEQVDRDADLARSRWSADQALRTADALRRVVVREHERVDIGELSDVPSSLVLCDAGLIRLPSQDSVMSAVLSSNGVWEPDVAELVDALIEPESVFLDVGAYVGYHAVRVLSRLGTSGTVVAVEPHPDAVKLLRHNVIQNVSGAVAERLAVLPVAAWDSRAALVARPAGGGGYGVAPQDQGKVITATEDDLPVEGVRLDRELDALPVADGQRLSVVKVDVPGWGHRVLGGLVRRLRKDRPHVIVAVDGPLTSGFGDDPAVVLREFRTWGYELVRLGQDRPVSVDDLLPEVAAGAVRTVWLRPVASR